MTLSRITTFSNDGLSFDVLDEGPLDGEVVVLLHGFPERASCWRSVVPLLHAAGLRTLAPDQRGYSPGARPPRRRDYVMPLLVGDIAALIGSVGRPVHLVGHDWGAAVAWAVAGSRPELVTTLTTFSVPHTGAFLKAMRTSSQGLKSWYMAAFQVPRAAEALAARPGGRFDASLRAGGMTREEVERCRREVVDYGALPGGLGYYRAIPFTRHPGGAPVTVPTTFVWSDGDGFVGRAAAELCGDYVTGAFENVELAGVTHWIPTQAPDAAAEAILDRVVARG